ncbi:hypothetical protein NDA18_000471 [Ustilago nuda]|nr:hypothetical protein NDA18_000471 [Ustilago nuda]
MVAKAHLRPESQQMASEGSIQSLSVVEKGSEGSHPQQPGSKQRKTRPRNFLASLGALVFILALTLGLGLGLGLSRKHRTQSGAATSSSKIVPGATASNLAFIPREQLVDPTQLTLSPTWDRNAPPQDRIFNWTLTQVLANPAGATKQMRLVNGLYPGPLIEANIGDRIIVHVENKMPVPTTIHWHGQYQRGSNEMDGSAGITECGIAPGTTFTYNWTVQQSGSYWWHSHYGPTYADGLFGPLILHGDDEEFKMTNPNNAAASQAGVVPTVTIANGIAVRTDYDQDHIFVVNNAYQADSFTVAAIAKSKAGPPGGEQGDEPTPDYGMINGLGFSNCGLAPNATSCISDPPQGKSAYNFTVPANKRVRMRVINAGSLATFRFSVDGHNMTVIEADGIEVEPVIVQSLNVMVAQRYSVIIETDKPVGAYAVRAEVMDDMFAYDNPFLVMEQYAIMRYESVAASVQPMTNPSNSTLLNVTETLSTSQLVPITRIDAPASNMTTKLVVNFGLDAYSDWHAFFNQTTFTSEMAAQASLMKSYTFETSQRSSSNTSVDAYYNDPDEMIVTNTDVVVMDVIINNLDEGSHPFHLHGYSPFLIGEGAGNFQAQDQPNFAAARVNPMRRDVFSVPPFSWMAFRFVADNVGVWPFHCHLMPHMAIGLLMQFQVLPDQIAKLPVRDQNYNQCSAVYDWVQQNQNLLTSTGNPDYM